jgi:hypothetical protein
MSENELDTERERPEGEPKPEQPDTLPGEEPGMTPPEPETLPEEPDVTVPEPRGSRTTSRGWGGFERVPHLACAQLTLVESRPPAHS